MQTHGFKVLDCQVGVQRPRETQSLRSQIFNLQLNFQITLSEQHTQQSSELKRPNGQGA